MLERHVKGCSISELEAVPDGHDIPVSNPMVASPNAQGPVLTGDQSPSNDGHVEGRDENCTAVKIFSPSEHMDDVVRYVVWNAPGRGVSSFTD